MLEAVGEFSSGQVVKDRYEIQRCLGSGGMGSVYLAKDRTSGELVALKEIAPAVTALPGVTQRFRDEISVQTKIVHKHVVRAIDYVDEGSLQALIVEYVDGGHLGMRMGRGRLPVEELLSVLLQIAIGLEAIHASGVVHRDLKPENILLTREGEVKITDFGVAGLGRETTLTKAGALVGTAKYVPPEFVETGECDFRGDIYALGVLAFELVTGVSPFKSGDLKGLILERFKVTIREDLQVLAPECPAELRRIVAKAMSLSLAQRYQRARELINDLEQFKAAYDTRPAGETKADTQIFVPFRREPVSASSRLAIYVRYGLVAGGVVFAAIGAYLLFS